MTKINLVESVRKRLETARANGNASPREFMSEETARATIDSIFNNQQNGSVRTVCPVLIVVGGGTGAAIGRRIKAYVIELGMQAYVRIVVLDTDAREQESDGNLPGFSDEEFCHMKMDHVKTVLDEPDKHPELAARLDLGDPKIRSQLAGIAGKDLRQAGQVRMLGLVAFYANYPSVQAKLLAAIGHLNSRWAELKNQLDSEGQVRLQDRFYVLMIGSSVGGTFSSFAVDVGATIRRLISRRNVEMVLFMTTADVYERNMAGKADEWERIKTNCYATLRDTDAFCNGWAQQQNVKIGRNQREAMKIPAGLFSQIYLIQRCDANGNDLESQQAVFDTIALHLAADICLTIGGKLSSLQMNDVARQGMSTCPDTNLPRHFSTLSATALVLPRALMVQYATARQIAETLSSVVLGQERAVHDVKEDVDAWLVEVNLEQRSSHNGANNIVVRVRHQSAPAVETFLVALFRVRTAKRRVHFKNRKFPETYLAARQRFSDTDLPEIQAAMERVRGTLADKAAKALRVKLAGLMTNGGLRGAEAFLKRLETIIAVTVKELEVGIRDDASTHAKWDEAAKEGVAKLTTFLGRWGTSEQKQLHVEKCFRNAINFVIDCEAKQQTIKLLIELRAEVQQKLTTVTAEIGCVMAELELFRIRMADNRESRAVTGDNLAEINIAPPGFFDQFYDKNPLTGQALINRIAVTDGQSVSSIIFTAGSDKSVIAKLSSEALDHFTEALSSMNVVDVLVGVFEKGGAPADIAQAQIRQALSKCTPMWDADLGRIDEAFADTVVIGIPQHQAPNGGRVVDNIRQEAAALMNGDSLYQAEANIVTTNDPARIYIVRRAHGGRPHYLRHWADWRASYRRWLDNGGHPVHIIPKKLVATLPPMEPRDEMSKADQGFALALAYGWVAQRGPFYYRNLEQKNRSGITTFMVPLNSHWNGIAFEKHSPRLVPGSALQTFVASGRMEFSGRSDIDPRQRLAQGREEALEAFRKDDGFVDLVFEAFNSLCESSGNTNVASELELYLYSLDNRFKVGGAHFDQVREEIELLAALLTKLHASS